MADRRRCIRCGHDDRTLGRHGVCLAPDPAYQTRLVTCACRCEFPPVPQDSDVQNQGQGPKSGETEADRRALGRLPDGWFDVDDVYGVRCARFRCERLERQGLLESHVVGEFPHDLKTEWRKV